MRQRHAARVICAFIIGFIFSSHITVETQAQTPVEAFARMPKYAGMSISPDGQFLATKVEEQGKYYFVIYRISGSKLERTFAGDPDDLQVRWTRWASPTRVLVSLGFASRRYGTPTYESRLLAINFDGSKVKDMVRQKRHEYIIQQQDRVIDFLLDDPDHVLMSYNDDDPSRPRVYKVNIHKGKGSVIKGGEKGIYDWMTDRQGNVRIGWGQKDKKWLYIYRNVDDKKWQELRSWEALSTSNFYVRGFANDPNIIYVESNHEGGPNALYEYDLRTQQFRKKLFSHPEVDVGAIWFHKKTGRPRRVSYVLDGEKHVWLDPIAEQRFKMLETSLPGKSISVRETSPDDNIWVIHAGTVNNPGQYYVYNNQQKQIYALDSLYPELARIPLSDMHSFDYAARDGLRIPAYLSLPPGIKNISDAKNLPVVVMPHGGPTSRDYLAFDPFVQHLTNRGYAVFQMNFRGSSGYGAAFEAAGYREWGGKMQDDITDGVNHLISRGIADRNRICIAGISYGGYAAIMGAVKTPNLYKCAVGVNGVYDLRDVISSDRKYVGGRSGMRTAHIGNLSEKDFLAKASPDKRANEIRIPILLVATDDDRVVRSKQSKDMANALKRAKVDYTLLELENGGHGLNTTESRLTYMKELDAFLAKHLK